MLASAAAFFEGDEGTAVRVLGHLFRLTEVYLWDDAKVKDGSSWEREQEWISAGAGTTADGSSMTVDRVTEEYSSIEDVELTSQMGALGLPMSFSTNKEKRSRLDSLGKGRGLLRKCDSIAIVKNKTVEFSEFVVCENVDSSTIPCGNMNFLCHNNHIERQHEVFICDSEEEHLGGCTLANGEDDSEGDRFCSVNKDDNVKKTDLVSTCHGTKTSEIDKMVHIEILENREVLEFEKSLANSSEKKSFDYHGESKLCSQQEEKYMDFCPLTYQATHTDRTISGTTALQISECPTGSSPSSALSDQLIDNPLNNIECWKFGVWSVIWDEFYKRNYFYNSETQESTWYPPPGLEYFASFSTSCADKSTVDLVEDQSSSSLKNSTQLEDEPSPKRNQSSSSVRDSNLYLTSDSLLDMIPIAAKELSEEIVQLHTSEMKDHSTGPIDISKNIDKGEIMTSDETYNTPEFSEEVSVNNCLTTKLNDDGYMATQASEINDVKSNHKSPASRMKRRSGRVQKKMRQQGVVGDLPANIAKYWCQRYSLFSLYDNGIKMDEEGWFSVTPESIAKHHASRCGKGIVIDCFTGVGGNAIQFAKKSSHVIAIDIDPQKIEFGQHNAKIYGVNNKIDFIIGDFFQLAAYLKGDTVFLSPPWGGPDYKKFESYDLKSMLKPHDGYYLFKLASMVASRVVMFLPRNVNINQLAELSLSLNPPWKVEVEKNILNGKCKAITAYFTSPTWEQSTLPSEM